MRGAATPTPLRNPTNASAISVPRGPRIPRTNTEPMCAVDASGIAEPRVGERGEDVGDQAADDDERPGNDNAASGDVVVERLHGVDGEQSEPMPAEHVFNEVRAA